MMMNQWQSTCSARPAALATSRTTVLWWLFVLSLWSYYCTMVATRVEGYRMQPLPSPPFLSTAALHGKGTHAAFTTTTTTSSRRGNSGSGRLVWLASSPKSSSDAVAVKDEPNKAKKNQDDSNKNKDEPVPFDYEVPDDAVVVIQPRAMRRLRELRMQQLKKDGNGSTADSASSSPYYLVLRMGVRSGGCSGMSYVMDFDTPEGIRADDDQVDVYEQDKIQCVVDSKSMLYLYGLQLDYSDELIGGGFKFYNPNAEESCGCGSSFGV
jgi:iron-sulfur cluster assembly accessory protein